MFDQMKSDLVVANDVTSHASIQRGTQPRASSWLHLIAEMQGVPQVSLIRASFKGISHTGGVCVHKPLRLLFQVEDSSGGVLGSATWEGDAEQLMKGSSIDLGYSLCQLKEPSHHSELIMRARLLDSNIKQPSSCLSLEALRDHQLLLTIDFQSLKDLDENHALRRAGAVSNRQW